MEEQTVLTQLIVVSKMEMETTQNYQVGKSLVLQKQNCMNEKSQT